MKLAYFSRSLPPCKATQYECQFSSVIPLCIQSENKIFYTRLKEQLLLLPKIQSGADYLYGTGKAVTQFSASILGLGL